MTGQPNPVEPPDVDPEPRVFDRITDAVFALDEEFQFTYLNTRAEKLLEANAEDLLGERIWEAHPGSKETELYDAFHDVLETQQSTERELYYDPLTSGSRCVSTPPKPVSLSTSVTLLSNGSTGENSISGKRSWKHKRRRLSTGNQSSTKTGPSSTTISSLLICGIFPRRS